MKKIILILIVVILLITVFYLFVEYLNKTKEFKVMENTVTEENKDYNDRGYIEGSLYGWSEVLPNGLHICAKNMNTKYYYCTDESFNDPKFKYGRGYKLEVPVGHYQVAGLYPGSLINPEKTEEYKSISENCNQNDQNCLTTLNTIKVFSNEFSIADLNSKGELDLFKTFDLKQYPNYIK